AVNISAVNDFHRITRARQHLDVGLERLGDSSNAGGDRTAESSNGNYCATLQAQMILAGFQRPGPRVKRVIDRRPAASASHCRALGCDNALGYWIVPLASNRDCHRQSGWRA